MGLEQNARELEFASFKQSMRGVKDLVDSGVTQIPEFYIRPESERSQQSKLPLPHEIPVIDLAGLHGPGHAQVIQSIAKASEEWGFFQIINHGVPSAAMQDMINVVEEFFNMPAADRMEYYSTNLWSTTRFGTSHNPSHESVLEWKDYLRHPCLPLDEAMLTWPTKPSSYRLVASNYCRAIKIVGDRLLAALSESLGLEPSYLDRAFGDAKLQEMFSNYYPPCPNPELTIGISEHSDAGGITILLQNDVEGLEVLKDGHWYTIKPVKDALIVNLADQIQILSNGRFRSVQHRAKVNVERLRISIPTFYQPSREAEIFPIPELVDEGHPPLYKMVKFEDYVDGFFRIKLHGKAYLDTFKI